MTSEHEHENGNQKGWADLSTLSRIGGIAALLLVIYSLEMMVQIVVLGSQPTSAAQAFDLLQHHRVLALLRLDLPTIAVMPLYYLVFLGLFAALRRNNYAHSLLATALAFVGTTLLLATPTALSMLPLSDKFADATSDVARNQLLAAGEALMAADIWHSTGAILGAVLLQCGAVLISIVMLRGSIFSKTTAWMGIVMHGLDLAHIFAGLFLPIFAAILLSIAGLLYRFWFLLVGLRMLRLASDNHQQHQA